MDDLDSKKIFKKIRHDLGAPVSAIKVVRDLLPSGDEKDLLSVAVDRIQHIMEEIRLLQEG